MLPDAGRPHLGPPGAFPPPLRASTCPPIAGHDNPLRAPQGPRYHGAHAGSSLVQSDASDGDRGISYPEDGQVSDPGEAGLPATEAARVRHEKRLHCRRDTYGRHPHADTLARAGISVLRVHRASSFEKPRGSPPEDLRAGNRVGCVSSQARQASTQGHARKWYWREWNRTTDILLVRKALYH